MELVGTPVHRLHWFDTLWKRKVMPNETNNPQDGLKHNTNNPGNPGGPPPGPSPAKKPEPTGASAR